MKRIIGIFLMLAVFLSAMAYTPLVREGVKWVYACGYLEKSRDTKFTTMTLEFKGDTVLNDVTYAKCYRTFGIDAESFDRLYGNAKRTYILSTDPEPIAYCREISAGVQHGVVVVYDENYTQTMLDFFDGTRPGNYDPFNTPNKEYLLYLLSDNDDVFTFNSFFYTNKLSVEERSTLTYVNADTIDVNGMPVCRFTAKDSINSLNRTNYSHFVEGIGYDLQCASLSSNFLSPFGNITSEYGTNLIKTWLNHVVQGDKIIYKSPSFSESFIESTMSSIEDIEDATTADDNYYNLMGQPVAHPEDAPGIYIHEGKKVVVK